MNPKLLIISFALILFVSAAVMAQDNPALVAPEGFTAFDTPNDSGKSISLTWKKSALDRKGIDYIVYGATQTDGAWAEIGRLDSTRGFKSDSPEYFGLSKINQEYHFYEVRGIPGIAEECIPGMPYYFRLEMMEDGRLLLGTSGIVSAQSENNWFDKGKLNVLAFVIIFSVVIAVFIRMARQNKDLFVRHIPGLDAIEEAIGRATEMGKPILYLNGLSGMESLSTIASTSILGKVARKVANYDSQIMVPCYDPIVMSVCQEVVKEAYAEAGRPDAFKGDNIFFITNDQFAYAASVDGMIMRHKPAANLFMGYYYAEALLLAETGAATGAIQIAGTDSVTQLPFFIATCDYTLMGEELYAASAYLSREPLQMGSLKGQDFSKAFIMIIILVGVVLSTADITLLVDLFKTF
jgi:hypothetical protein